MATVLVAARDCIGLTGQGGGPWFESTCAHQRCAGTSPARPSAQAPFGNHSAAPRPGSAWHASGLDGLHCDPRRPSRDRPNALTRRRPDVHRRHRRPRRGAAAPSGAGPRGPIGQPERAGHAYSLCAHITYGARCRGATRRARDARTSGVRQHGHHGDKPAERNRRATLSAIATQDLQIVHNVLRRRIHGADGGCR